MFKRPKNHYFGWKSIEFTPNSIIIQDKHSKDLVAIGEVDHQFHVYTSHFAPIIPSVDVHTQAFSVDTFEEIQYGHLNLGILPSTEVLKTHIDIPSPSSIVIFDIVCVAIIMATCDSMQQDTHCLPDIATWDENLTNIASLFVKSHILDLGDTIDCIHLLFDKDDSSSIIVREHSYPLIHSLHDHSSWFDTSVDILSSIWRKLFYLQRRYLFLWIVF